VSWPVATLADGTTSDLNLAQGPESEIGDKLFAGPLGRAENWCVLERPKAGLSIRIAFNTAATPYLGLWICYGGWPERPGAKQICVALEPATAPVDSLAQTGTWSRTLGAGETFSWTMTVEIQSIVKVN
jgi:galactose mutarotase-like enzyme